VVSIKKQPLVQIGINEKTPASFKSENTKVLPNRFGFAETGYRYRDDGSCSGYNPVATPLGSLSSLIIITAICSQVKNFVVHGTGLGYRQSIIF